METRKQKYCLKCKKEFSDNDLFCDECGGKLKLKTISEKKSIWKKLFLIFAITILVIGAISTFFLITKRTDISRVNIYDLKNDIEQNFKYNEIRVNKGEMSEEGIQEIGVKKAYVGAISDLNEEEIGSILIGNSENIQNTKDILLKDGYIEDITKVSFKLRGNTITKYYSEYSVSYLFSIKNYIFIINILQNKENYAMKIAKDYLKKYK